MVVLLAGGSGFTRRHGLRRIKERLENVPEASRVRDEPSSIRPRRVIADIDIQIEMFVGRALLRIEVLWRPRERTDVQRVQWVDDAVSLGWHRDDDHPELGTTHVQLEFAAETHHDEGHIEVEAPVSVLEICLERLPNRLEETVSD
jgi:hypothetical protein